jgi:hypothetical protein
MRLRELARLRPAANESMTSRNLCNVRINLRRVEKLVSAGLFDQEVGSSRKMSDCQRTQPNVGRKTAMVMSLCRP